MVIDLIYTALGFLTGMAAIGALDLMREAR